MLIPTDVTVTALIQAGVATVSVFVSGAAVFVAYAALKTSRRAVWLTGALESHSTMRLRLEAKKEGVKVIWWDPTFPTPVVPRHGEEATVQEIYLYLPLELRQGKKRHGRLTMQDKDVIELRAQNEALLIALAVAVRALEAASALDRPIAELLLQTAIRPMSAKDPRVPTLERFADMLRNGVGPAI